MLGFIYSHCNHIVQQSSCRTLVYNRFSRVCNTVAESMSQLSRRGRSQRVCYYQAANLENTLLESY